MSSDITDIKRKVFLKKKCMVNSIKYWQAVKWIEDKKVTIELAIRDQRWPCKGSFRNEDTVEWTEEKQDEQKWWQAINGSFKMGYCDHGQEQSDSTLSVAGDAVKAVVVKNNASFCFMESYREKTNWQWNGRVYCDHSEPLRKWKVWNPLNKWRKCTYLEHQGSFYLPVLF